MRLHAAGLRVAYGGRVVLDDIVLDADPGEVVGILGANGSGKSTLLKALAGLVRHAGTVAWNGGTAPPGSIGYMPQDNAARAALTAFEVVLLGRIRSLGLRVGRADLAAAEATMAELGIDGLAARRIGELSGGQRQLAFMAQVLAAGPRVLLLDEPTSALDIAHQLHVLGMLRAATRRRGLTTIVVLHDLNAAARFTDRLALLRRGRLAGLGVPREVLRADRLEASFGVEVAIDAGSDGHPVVLPLRPSGQPAA